MLEQKPHSIHGVCETLDSRFKNTKQGHVIIKNYFFIFFFF